MPTDRCCKTRHPRRAAITRSSTQPGNRASPRSAAIRRNTRPLISAPASLQTAVASYLYNQYGFQPWTVGNATLAADIQAAGGSGAFEAPGTLSTNPSAYAAADTESLGSFFGTGGTAIARAGGTGLTVTTASAPAAPGAAGGGTAGTTTAGSGPLARPFEWAYQQLITGVIGQVIASINQIETLANGRLSAILVLAVIVTGIGHPDGPDADRRIQIAHPAHGLCDRLCRTGQHVLSELGGECGLGSAHLFCQ